MDKKTRPLNSRGFNDSGKFLEGIISNTYPWWELNKFEGGPSCEDFDALSLL